jgi:uncharacterized membrane protein YsdA (DUF1294 family)
MGSAGKRRRPPHYAPVLLAAAATAVLFGLLGAIAPWHFYWSWLTAVSVTTFALIALDKWLALRGLWRIPEKALHLFTLAGGFPGQWLGRQIFRHKTNVGRHPAFTVVLLLSLLLHAGLIYLMRNA